MSAFPSILTSYTNPTPTSPLNAPSHSGIEIAQNSGLNQLEATVGLAGASSTLGTIIGDLRSPASNGGGHVQSANKGGTGQTSYNKGDILIASSASVLSKLAIGADGTVLKADSTQSSGTTWSTVVANRVQVSTTPVSLSGGISSVANALFSASIIGGTLGTGNAIRFKGTIDNFNNTISTGQFYLNVQYGQQSVAGITVTPASSVFGMKGIVEGMIVGNGSTGSQKGYMSLALDTTEQGITNLTSFPMVRGYASSTLSADSTVNQDLIITYKSDGPFGQTASSSILATLFVVDKIV